MAINNNETTVLELAPLLSQHDIPSVDELPKEQDGWRILKLAQYPERTVVADDGTETTKRASNWLWTSKFNTVFSLGSLKLTSSKWITGQTVSNDGEQNLALYTDDSATDEELHNILKNNNIFIYYHESETKPPLSIEEYIVEVQKQTLPQDMPQSWESVSLLSQASV